MCPLSLFIVQIDLPRVQKQTTMKKAIVVTALVISNLIASAQTNRVNIQLVDSTQDVCKVLLWPQEAETGTLSNLVFTLKWKTSQQLALGQALNAPIPIHRIGQPVAHGRYTYQVYVGLGFDSHNFDINLPDTVVIDKTGVGEVTIANDAFSNSLEYNGQYYISIGGYDVTGDVIRPTPGRVDRPRRVDYNLYYDPTTQQVLIEHNGVYTTTLNQQVTVVDKSKLRLIR